MPTVYAPATPPHENHIRLACYAAHDDQGWPSMIEFCITGQKARRIAAALFNNYPKIDRIDVVLQSGRVFLELTRTPTPPCITRGPYPDKT